jgi:hypothetical protein
MGGKVTRKLKRAPARTIVVCTRGILCFLFYRLTFIDYSVVITLILFAQQTTKRNLTKFLINDKTPLKNKKKLN